MGNVEHNWTGVLICVILVFVDRYEVHII